QLTGSQIAFVSVFDDFGASLITHPRYVYGIELGEPLVQTVNRKDSDAQAAVSRRVYISNEVQADPRDCYRTLAQQLSLERAVIVPLIVGDRSLGELGIANRKQRPYSPSDEAMLRTIAAQVSAALDRVTLYQSAGQNLNRRMQELDAISRVSNELTLTLDLDYILNIILEEAIRTTAADGGTIALFQPSEHWRQRNRPDLERRLGGDLEGIADIERDAARLEGEALLVDDYATSPLQPQPEGMRSALAAAFVYEGRTVGVIHLYHRQPHTFDEREVEFVRTLATKAALGYGNAIRYQDQVERSNQLRRRVEQLNQIFELGQMLQTNTDPVTMLEAIAYSVQQSVGFDIVLMLLVDEDGGILRRVAQAGLPLDVFEASKSHILL